MRRDSAARARQRGLALAVSGLAALAAAAASPSSSTTCGRPHPPSATSLWMRGDDPAPTQRVLPSDQLSRDPSPAAVPTLVCPKSPMAAFSPGGRTAVSAFSDTIQSKPLIVPDGVRPPTAAPSGSRSINRLNFALSLSQTPYTATACFAATFSRWKSTRHMQSRSIHISSSQKHESGRTPLVMWPFKSNQPQERGLRNDNNNWGLSENEERLSSKPEQSEGSDGGHHRRLLLIPLLMYSAVPFLPSFLLSALNDDYLILKQRFAAASAALPLAAPADSLEYLAASDAYNDSMRMLFVVLLSKRLALYFLATCATAYAGWRASRDVAAMRYGGVVSGPGDALDRLTREILSGEEFLASGTVGEDGSEGASERHAEGQEENLFATLVDDRLESDNIGNAVAVALPLVLAVSLGVSYLAITMSGNSPSVDKISPSFVPEIVTSSLPYLASLPNVLLCLYLVSTEFRWALPKNDGSAGDDSERSPPSGPSRATISSSPMPATLPDAGNFLALVYVVGAYYAKFNPTLDLWPLQNGVNISLSTTVARALSPFLLPAVPSPKSIRTIALALVGLVLFDATFTFGTVANAAAAVDPSMSIMETVARSKLASSTPPLDTIASPLAYLWQPGLLEIFVGHGSSSPTEALGLGDIVFPSVLVAWGFTADSVDPGGDGAADNSGTDAIPPGRRSGYSYATASVAGYILGSFATEIVGSFSLLGNVSGLPALVFLVPSMLGAVTMMAWSRNELQDVWGTHETGP